MDSRGTNLSGSKSFLSMDICHCLVLCFLGNYSFGLLSAWPSRQAEQKSRGINQRRADDARWPTCRRWRENCWKTICLQNFSLLCDFVLCGMEGILVEETIQKPKGTWLADSSSCSVTLLSDTGDRKYLLPPNGRPRLIIISVWVGLCLRNIDYLLLIGFIFQILGTYWRRG